MRKIPALRQRTIEFRYVLFVCLERSEVEFIHSPHRFKQRLSTILEIHDQFQLSATFLLLYQREK